MQAVSFGQTAVAIWPFHEFVAKTRMPLRSILGRLRHWLHVQARRILTADLQGDGIVESERNSESQPKPSFVLAFHLLVNLIAVAASLLLENGGQRRARILRIDINSPRQDCLLTDVRARQIETALHFQLCVLLNLLCDKLAEDEGLGEILGSHHNEVAVLRRTR